MSLELGEVVAKFDGGIAEGRDLPGPFPTVQSTTPTPVASFTMPYDGSVIVTMQFNRGINTTASNIRGLAVEVGDSRIEAQLTYNAETKIFSCYGDLPAGEATILVKNGSTSSTGTTTPTLLRVITWRTNA